MTSTKPQKKRSRKSAALVKPEVITELQEQVRAHPIAMAFGAIAQVLATQLPQITKSTNELTKAVKDLTKELKDK